MGLKTNVGSDYGGYKLAWPKFSGLFNSISIIQRLQ